MIAEIWSPVNSRPQSQSPAATPAAPSSCRPWVILRRESGALASCRAKPARRRQGSLPLSLCSAVFSVSSVLNLLTFCVPINKYKGRVPHPSRLWFTRRMGSLTFSPHPRVDVCPHTLAPSSHQTRKNSSRNYRRKYSCTLINTNKTRPQTHLRCVAAASVPNPSRGTAVRARFRMLALLRSKKMRGEFDLDQRPAVPTAPNRAKILRTFLIGTPSRLEIDLTRSQSAKIPFLIGTICPIFFRAPRFPPITRHSSLVSASPHFYSIQINLTKSSFSRAFH